MHPWASTRYAALSDEEKKEVGRISDENKNLIKELERRIDPWRDGGPPGYLGSLLPFIKSENEVLQKQMGEHTLSDGTGTVFWLKPGGRFSWSGSKDWMSTLTWTEVEEYGNIKKERTGSKQLVVLTLTTEVVTDIEVNSALAPTADNSRLQESVALAAGVDKSLVTIRVASAVASAVASHQSAVRSMNLIFTATIAMTDSTAAALETSLASIPVADAAVKLALPNLATASTSLSPRLPHCHEPPWRKKANEAKKAAEKADEEAKNEANRPQAEKKEKKEKEVKKAVFRMCTASEVLEVLKARDNCALYPEDNQWVAYTSWWKTDKHP